MIKQVKELRVQIDGLIQLTKELKPIPHVCYQLPDDTNILLFSGNSKEIEKSVDSLILAKAWLGKVLAELGVESPYKSGYKEVKDIEPTADVANHNDKVSVHYHLPYTEMNHIEKVDWLRSEIEKLVISVKEIPVGETVRLIDMNSTMSEQSKFVPFSREFAIARTNCYNHLCEAKFQLGFELARIKESN